MSVRTLGINHIARIEGHGSIAIDVSSSGELHVDMHVEEPTRYFEQMIKGRHYTEVPYIASRICGICSATHAVTDIIAIEDAFGIEVNQRTKDLRKLLLHGSFLQNHATHLGILASPDYVGTDSVFEFEGNAKELLALGLEIKACGNELCNMIGGRAIHPITAVVGGFTSEPSKDAMFAMADKLEQLVEKCVSFADGFIGFSVPDFKTHGDMLALVSDEEYAVAGGVLKTKLSGYEFEPSEFKEYIVSETTGASTSLLSHLKNSSTYVTGPIARLNHSWDKLTKNARIVAAKAGFRPFNAQMYCNNICRAIELVDTADRCSDLLRNLALTDGDSYPKKITTKDGTGFGCTEAPRGTLFHSLSFDENGICTGGTILTPTAQNIANLEADVRAYAPIILDMDDKSFRLLIEKLVRAYDPCLSCAVH